MASHLDPALRIHQPSPAQSTVFVNTFCCESEPGSMQVVHSIADRETFDQVESVFPKPTDEFDHSYVYLQDERTLLTKWRNKACFIQCCGSGAYACAWLYHRNTGSREFKVIGEHVTLECQVVGGKLELKLPQTLPLPIEDILNMPVFMDETSGILFVQLASKQAVQNGHWLQNENPKNFLGNASALCIFAWDQPRGEGVVRYFTPRFGRDEDYVTGSVHRYLTPLVHNLFGATQQRWNQLSSHPGCLNSRLENNCVYISGYCSNA